MLRDGKQELSEPPSADAATPTTIEAPTSDDANPSTREAPNTDGPFVPASRAAPIQWRYLLIAGLLFTASTAGIWFTSGHSAPVTMEAIIATATSGSELVEANGQASAVLPPTGQQHSRNSSTALEEQEQSGVCSSKFEEETDYQNGRVSATYSPPVLC